MIRKNKYYTYVVEKDTTSIPLENFKDMSGNKFMGLINIQTDPESQSQVNPITQATIYKYNEEYRFIVNFSNTKTTVKDGIYYSMINVNDNGTWIKEEQVEAANTIEIKNRIYNYEYKLDKQKYENSLIINVIGKLKLEDITGFELDRGKDLFIRISLKDAKSFELIDIPIGTMIKVNSMEANEFGEVKIMEDISNNEIVQNVNLSVDMSNVLKQNRLEAGEYNLVIDFILSDNNIIQETNQYSKQIPITIISYEDSTGLLNYGLKAEILNNEQISIDKLQIIPYNEVSERIINLKYKGQLEDPKIKIRIQKLVKPFEFADIVDNLIKITLNDVEIKEITEILNSQDIKIVFNNSLEQGTYRILFELYDNNETKKTEDYVDFIIYK